jgi:hypothetical protein
MVWNGSTGYGAAESYLGMLAATLGDHARADGHFAAASEVHEREGVKGWEARNLCYWARSLFDAGTPERGRATAQRSLELARAHGFGTTAGRAELLLRATATSAARR